MSAVPDDVKEGDLVGWKFRAALVVGKVIDVEGDKLTLSPISKPETHVKRSREKVILESELDKEDVKEALREGGHMARRKMHSSSEKAQKMGLTKPHQVRRFSTQQQLRVRLHAIETRGRVLDV